MKKLLRTAAVIAAALLPLTACTSAEEIMNYSQYFYVMGTSATLLVAQKDGEDEKFASLKGEVSSMLTSAEDSLSATVSSSYIYKFNQAEAGEKVHIDKTAFEVLSLAKRMYEFTGGYYNPSVYYSVKAFGFPLSEVPKTLPDGQKVEAFCDLASHFGELQLSEENGEYYAVKPDYIVTADGVEYSLAIDLGGIGKGWCADRADEILSDNGCNYGYFNFGSSSMAIKRYYFGEDKTYSIEPRDPRGMGGNFCSIAVKDSKLSTSGDYEQYYEIDGVRYCHIINPFTGAPIQTGVASVTVIGGSAAEDDALTTALSCMDKLTAVDFINEKLTDRTVIMLIFEDGEGKIITNRPDDIKNALYDIGNRVENGRIVLHNVA